MASASQTETLTTSEKALENKVKEKEIVLSETVEVVKDKLVSDSNMTVTKEETPADEPEKESIVVVKAEESTEKGKDENGEKAVEQVELKEPVLEKDSVEEVIVKAVDEEKDENGEKKDVEENNEDMELVDVSESTDEAIGKQVEHVNVQSVKDVSAETAENKIKDVEVLEVETKPEASEKLEKKAKELAPEVEVVKAEETPDTTEQAKGKLEDIIVENRDSGINLGAEKTSEFVSSLCPEEIVPINQDSESAPEKEIEGDVSSPVDVIEKVITGEKHVVEESSKDEQENVSEAKDEQIKKDNELVSEGMSEETLKEKTDTEARERETEASKQEESITEKVAAVVKEKDEPKQQQQPEVVVKKKQPNSIISKLKQSLVKAKKAIIGKSQKNISTEEAKGNVNTKE